MAEKTLTIDRVEPLLLFGFNDSFLKKVESAFSGARVSARGNQVFIRGEDDSVRRIERILDELQMVLARNGTLTERDVETVVDLVTLGDGIRRADASDVVLFGPTGTPIKAKTPGAGGPSR